MSEQVFHPTRRRFLKTAVQLGAAVAAPCVVPSFVLGKEGATPPSEKIVMGAIGIGRKGSGNLTEALAQSDVRVVAVCEVRAQLRENAKKRVEAKYDNTDCAMYRDFRELLARQDIDAVVITTGPNNHGLISIYAARAGKDVYCEKPCTKSIAESLAVRDVFRRTGCVYQGGMQRRAAEHFQDAVELARSGRLGKLQRVHANCRPGTAHAGIVRLSQASGPGTGGQTPPYSQPPKEEFDWDLFLGTAAWRPVQSWGIELTLGPVGMGVLEWGSHTVDMCQWANNADDTVPVEYFPRKNDRATARYANGVELVMRDGNDGWLATGACSARFEGDAGWAEVGDGGLRVSSPLLLHGIRRLGGLGHFPEFIHCIRTRGKTRVNAEAACNTHIACHAANIAVFLDRKLKYDPVKHEFLGDDQANRLRGEALREPWRF